MGTGVLAYTLGMRHAFDADHIAAIDNTTRKFMSEGQRPMSTGFWFSLGHSSVVFGLTVLLGLGARALGGQVRNTNSPLHHYGGLVGTIVSGSFLYLIATLNLIILVGIVRLFVQMRQGRFDDSELENTSTRAGSMMWFFGPLARSIDAPWKMYPLGFLFGLGFDTATEVAFLVLAGTSVAAGLPFWAILSLPLLFAAGMSLLDTLDGSFMNFAYGWAFSKPVRKVYYNIAITGLSVFVAFYIGTLATLSRSWPTSSTCAAASGATRAASTSTGPGSPSWGSSWPCGGPSSTGVSAAWKSAGSAPRCAPSSQRGSAPTPLGGPDAGRGARCVHHRRGLRPARGAVTQVSFRCRPTFGSRPPGPLQCPNAGPAVWIVFSTNSKRWFDNPTGGNRRWM